MDNNTNTPPSNEDTGDKTIAQNNKSENQTAENKESQQSEGSQEAPLFAGKYKSQEDLEKGYKELESKLGELGQKASITDLLQEKFNVSPEQLRARIAQVEQEKKQQYYDENPLAPVFDELDSLKQKIEQQETEKFLAQEEKKLDSFIKENPEYEPFRDKILRLGLSEEQPYEEIAVEWFGKARAQGQQDAYNKIEIKQQPTSSGGQSGGQRRFSIEDLRTMSSKELEQILPHA